MLNMCLPLLHFRKGKLNQVKSNIRVCGEVKLLFIPSGRVCGNTLPRANTAPAEFPHTIIRLETGSLELETCSPCFRVHREACGSKYKLQDCHTGDTHRVCEM